MLENGYDADACCGLNRYESMWAITSVNANADARCGQGLRSNTNFELNFVKLRIVINFICKA